MKIALIVSTFPPYRGGMGTMAESYALGLKKSGNRVTVFTPTPPVSPPPAEGELLVATIKPWFKFGNAAFLPQLFWKLKGFDVVNLHYPFFGGAEVVWLLKLFKGKKMKLVINYQMDNFGSGLLGWIFKFNSSFVMPLILKSADKVIVTSIDYVEHSKAGKVYRKNPEKFVAISAGVDTDQFQPRPKDLNLLQKYQIAVDDKVVLFVGGLDSAHYFKGIDFLIKSWSNLNLAKVKLLIVGQGNLRDSYIEQARELNLADQIIFCEAVSADELSQYYNLADLLILPSIDFSEAFGIVQIEALASGVPVLVADLPGVRTVAGEAGLVFKVLDTSDLIKKLKMILTDDSLLLVMKQKARQVALSKYDKIKIGQDVDDLFNKIAKV